MSDMVAVQLHLASLDKRQSTIVPLQPPACNSSTLVVRKGPTATWLAELKDILAVRSLTAIATEKCPPALYDIRQHVDSSISDSHLRLAHQILLQD